jgi:hypothetical protein
MKNLVGALLLCIGFILAKSAAGAEPAPPSNAPNLEQARASFQQGVDLFHEGNFDAALAEFRKAYRVSPSYRILFNIAQAYYEIHDYVNALKFNKQYLADGGAEIPPARRAQVEETNQKLQTRIAQLDITVNVDGAEVRVDDVVVGTSPLPGPIAVNPGPRRVWAAKAGTSAPVRTVSPAGGDRVKVAMEIAIPSRPRAVASESVTGTEASDPPRSRTPLIASLTVTGACAVATGVFAWLALSAKRDFDNDLSRYGVTASDIDSDRSRLRSRALYTDIAGAATLVAASVSLYFYVSAPASSTSRASKPSPYAVLAPTVGGLALQGGW